MCNKANISSFTLCIYENPIEPMKKITTPKTDNSSSNAENKVVTPTAGTLEFLKKFARTYYVEKSFPAPLNSIYVN